METIRAARPEDAAGIARVHIDGWRTTYKGILPDELLANLSYERSEQGWLRQLNDPEIIIFVAEDEVGKVVGVVSGGAEREGDPIYRAELYAIYVLQEAQGRGLGRRLASSLARQLVDRQYSSMLLWVLPDNPACRFYEALGGQVVKQRQDQIGGALYDELAYGWTALAPLYHL